jgi:glycosyltransferase involved in cell wall biosynthesis
MQIVIVHYTAPPIVGGVESVIAYHTRELVGGGHSVTILAGRAGDVAMLADANVIVLPELDSQHPDNLHIAQALEHGLVPRKFEAFQNRIEEAVTPICVESDAVIVHNAFNLHFNLPLTAALHGMINRGRLTRMIAWCHDISRYVNPTSGAELRSGFPWDLLCTYRPEVTYVAVSPQRQRTLAGILGCSMEIIHVIPNGVDAQTLLGLSDLTWRLVEEFDLLKADLIALMPCRITRAKNIEYALRVIAALKASGLRPKLVVTGPPDPHSSNSQAYWSELLALRRELELDQDVVFIYEGTPLLPSPLTIDAPTVAELFRVCDLVLMPSHREGFGIPILEGGLVGKPVFCTAVPVLEQVGAELVYQIGTDEPPDHLAARIQAWTNQDALYRLRWRVRKDYTWSAISQQAIQPLLAHTVLAPEHRL